MIASQLVSYDIEYFDGGSRALNAVGAVGAVGGCIGLLETPLLIQIKRGVNKGNYTI